MTTTNEKIGSCHIKLNRNPAEKALSLTLLKIFGRISKNPHLSFRLRFWFCSTKQNRTNKRQQKRRAACNPTSQNALKVAVPSTPRTNWRLAFCESHEELCHLCGEGCGHVSSSKIIAWQQSCDDVPSCRRCGRIPKAAARHFASHLCPFRQSRQCGGNSLSALGSPWLGSNSPSLSHHESHHESKQNHAPKVQQEPNSQISGRR